MSELLIKEALIVAEQYDSKTSGSFFGNTFSLFKQTFQEWLQDKAPQLGAALAYYTVFSLAPLILVLLAIVGVLFRDDPGGAWNKLTQHMSYFLDQSAVRVVQNIAQQASQRTRTFRRKRCVWSAPGRLEYDLGRESETLCRCLGIFTCALSIICNGWRHLFFTSCVTHRGRCA